MQDTDILGTTPGSSNYSPYNRNNIQICGFPFNDSIQLRWLMSSAIKARNSIYEDKWSLDDVQVYLITQNNSKILLADDFDNSLLR